MVCHVSLGQLTIRAAQTRPVSQQRVTLNKINSHHSLATHTHTHTHTTLAGPFKDLQRNIQILSTGAPVIIVPVIIPMAWNWGQAGAVMVSSSHVNTWHSTAGHRWTSSTGGRSSNQSPTTMTCNTPRPGERTTKTKTTSVASWGLQY